MKEQIIELIEQSMAGAKENGFLVSTNLIAIMSQHGFFDAEDDVIDKHTKMFAVILKALKEGNTMLSVFPDLEPSIDPSRYSQVLHISKEADESMQALEDWNIVNSRTEISDEIKEFAHILWLEKMVDTLAVTLSCIKRNFTPEEFEKAVSDVIAKNRARGYYEEGE